MNKLLVLLLPLVIVSSGFAQKKFSKEYLEAKLENFQNMKSKGQTLVGVGVACNVVGLTMFVIGVSTSDSNDEGATVGLVLGGYVLFLVGIPLDVAGGVVWGISSSRVRRYKQLLKNYNKDLSLGFTRRGLTLSLNF